MIAASTPLPVIGVPVKGSTLDGMDSLLSIVQMPRGVPVATVAINNSVSAHISVFLDFVFRLLERRLMMVRSTPHYLQPESSA